ncbi:hypothetical protein [Candidatus Pyrohabitans sp.]
MDTFEYEVVNAAPARRKGMLSLQNLLNKMGKRGWELTAIDGDHYIFKRRL